MRRPYESLSEEERIERLKRLARKALAIYGLDEADLRYIEPATNVIFEVRSRSGGHYVLRICESGRDEASLQREMLWLTSLRRFSDLGVPEPIIMQTGEFVRTVSMEGVPGRRSCMLFQWVDGSFVDKKLTPDHVWRVGRFAGELHRQSERFRWPDEWTPAPWMAPALVSVVDRELESRGIDPGVVARLQLDLERLAEAPKQLGVIHGAFRQDHVLFHEDEVRAIDFETCSIGPYLEDLATFCEGVSGRDNERDLFEALFNGYEAVRPLPDRFERLIGALRSSRRLDGLRSRLPLLHHPPDDPRRLRAEAEVDGVRELLLSTE